MIGELVSIAAMADRLGSGQATSAWPKEIVPFRKGPHLILTQRESGWGVELRSLDGVTGLNWRLHAFTSFPSFNLSFPESFLCPPIPPKAAAKEAIDLWLAALATQWEGLAPNDFETQLQTQVERAALALPEASLWSAFARDVLAAQPKLLWAGWLDRLQGFDPKSLFQLIDQGKLPVLLVKGDDPLLTLGLKGVRDVARMLVPTEESGEVDVLGNSGKAVPYPKIAWPKLAPMPSSMLSINKEARHLRRWDGATLPDLSQGSEARFRSALHELLAPERENVTWKYLPSRKSILLVDAAPWLALWSAPEAADVFDWEVAATELLALGQGHYYLISSPGRAHIRIESAGRLESGKIADAMKRWCEIEKVWTLPKVLRGSGSPFPARASLCSSLVFTCCGRTWTMRDDGRRIVPDDFLWTSLPCSLSPLWAQRLKRVWAGLAHQEKFSQKVLAALRAQLYLTLFFLPPSMNRDHPAYLLGRLLSRADLLHRQWQDERGTGACSPHQLAGARHYELALRDPAGALAATMRRLAPAVTYLQHCAQERSGSPKMGLRVGALRLFQSMAARLPLPLNPFSVEEQTLFGLGYSLDPWEREAWEPAKSTSLTSTTTL